MSIIKDIIELLLSVVFLMCACENGTCTAQDLKITTYRENMTDTGKSFIEYTCTAEMDDFNRLSWYKLKGTKHMLLNMIQQQEMDRVNKTVTLHMSLDNTDRNSEIYCLKENRTKQRTYYKEIISWIQLSFNRTIPPLEKAHVNIQPNPKIVYFDTGKILRSVCRGTAPTDDRKLTWYVENYEHSEQQSDDISITPQYELVESQKYDSEKYETVLQLELKESHNLKRLFCAQDMHVQVKEDNGEYGIVRFAQRVRSQTITLILRNSDGLVTESVYAFDGGKDAIHRNTTYVPLWSVVSVTALALILLIALVVIIKKWRNKEAEFKEKERLWNRSPLQVPNENHYEAVYSHGAGLLRRPKK